MVAPPLHPARPNDARGLFATNEGLLMYDACVRPRDCADRTIHTLSSAARIRFEPSTLDHLPDVAPVVTQLADYLSRLPEDAERLVCRQWRVRNAELWGAVDRYCRTVTDELAVHLDGGNRPYDVWPWLPPQLRDLVYVATLLLECIADELPATGQRYPGLVFCAVGDLVPPSPGGCD